MLTMKPKIVIMQNQLGDLGGVSTFCDLLSRGLSERGYEVEIGAIHPAIGQIAEPYLSDIPTWTLAPSPRPISEFGRFRRQSRHRKVMKAFHAKVLDAAQTRFSALSPETIVLFTQVYARERLKPVIDTAVKNRQFRVIGQFHSSFAAAKAWKDLRRVLASYADDDLFVCLTEEDARGFQRAGLNNSTSIYNPAVAPAGVAQSTLENPVVVSLSRYDSNKQIDHMLDAWSMVVVQEPEWKLHLYGSGPLEEKVRQQIVDQGLLDNVVLAGATNNAMDVLSKASISILASRNEGFPMSLVESGLVGVPSVAYSCSPGVRVVLDHGRAGVLVEPNDTGALARGLLALIRDTAAREQMGAAAREHVTQTLSIGRILDQWEQTFEEVLR